MISVHFIGRVGKDAQIKSGQHGDFLTMDIADEFYSKGENKTRWTRIRTSDPNLIKKAKYFTKGKPLEIRGELMDDDVWNYNGEKRWQHAVKATSIDFIPGGKKKQNDQDEQQNIPSTSVPSPDVIDSSQSFAAPDDKNDELPF